MGFKRKTSSGFLRVALSLLCYFAVTSVFALSADTKQHFNNGGAWSTTNWTITYPAGTSYLFDNGSFWGGFQDTHDSSPTLNTVFVASISVPGSPITITYKDPAPAGLQNFLKLDLYNDSGFARSVQIKVTDTLGNTMNSVPSDVMAYNTGTNYNCWDPIYPNVIGFMGTSEWDTAYIDITAMANPVSLVQFIFTDDGFMSSNLVYMDNLRSDSSLSCLAGLFTPTNTATNTATNTKTNTPTVTATSTPTNTPTITSTNTSTNSPTNTWTATATSTPTNTATNTVPQTATNTATVTSTNTVTLTATNTGVNTSTNTPTVTSTSTPTNTGISTPTNTATRTPTGTPTDTAVSTATNTRTDTATTTATRTPTNTATVTDTPTITSTPTNTPTATPGLNVWPNPLNFLTGTGNFYVGYVAPGWTLNVYTLTGEPVISDLQSVTGTIVWDGRNKNGVRVASGLYYYLVRNGSSMLAQGKLLVVNGK